MKTDARMTYHSGCMGSRLLLPRRESIDEPQGVYIDNSNSDLQYPDLACEELSQATIASVSTAK